VNRLEQIANWITGHVGLVAWIVAVLIALLAADTVATVHRARRRNQARQAATIERVGA